MSIASAAAKRRGKKKGNPEPGTRNPELSAGATGVAPGGTDVTRGLGLAPWPPAKYRTKLAELRDAHGKNVCSLESAELEFVNWTICEVDADFTERDRTRANNLLTKYAWALPDNDIGGAMTLDQDEPEEIDRFEGQTPAQLREQCRALLEDRAREVTSGHALELANAAGMNKMAPWSHDFRTRVCELLAKYSPPAKPTAKPPSPQAPKSPTPTAEQHYATRNIGSEALSRIPLDKIDRHPDNRAPTAKSIAAMAAAIERDGLLEPLVARRVGGRWQLISGETRVLALRKLGRKGEIDAHVVQCDDARARELLVVYNEDREDVSPIDRAKQMRAMIDADGKTSDQVAAFFRLGTGGAVRNLLRLLDLPAVWQERIAAGELPQSFGREILQCVGIAAVMEELESEFVIWRKLLGKDAAGEKYNSWNLEQSPFATRAALQEMIAQLVEDETRPITSGATSHYNEHGIPYGEYPCLFPIDDALRAKLQVVTISRTRLVGKGNKAKEVTEPIEVATNAKLYDSLQVPAIKAHLAAKGKKQADQHAACDAKALAAKHAQAKPTPAQVKARNAEQAKQLAARVRGWRHRWLAEVIATELDGGEIFWSGGKLALWMILVRDGHDAAMRAVLNKKPFDYVGDLWKALAKLPASANPHDVDTAEAIWDVLQQVGAELLRKPDSDSRHPHVPFEVVDGLAAEMKIDVATEWLKLQTIAETDRRETFYLLFQSGQLDALGQELGVHLADATKRGDKVRILTNIGRTLPLPKCLGGEKATAKKSGKKQAARGK